MTRGLVFALDVSPSEERLLVSYCGARRFAYNWVIGLVTENLAIRRAERAAGVPEERLTPAVSWSAMDLGVRWNEVKGDVAPWWREVSMHAFRSGIADAATALRNWSESRSGKRKGPKVGFPRFKKRDRSVPSVSFVEINHQRSSLHPDRHHVRLMFPRNTPDREVRVSNPKALESQLHRLRRLDRSVARSRRGSKNQQRLLARRARLYGRTAKTRALHLHLVTTTLAGAFDVIAVETLNVKGMASRKRHLGRRMADASLGELRRQLEYKTTEYGHTLVALDRFYPSSKTCSNCGHAIAKLTLSEGVFRCDRCGFTADRDVNAAHTIHHEAARLLQQQDEQDVQSVAGPRPESAKR